MQRIEFYTINLAKVKGTGEFKCPKCRTMISPDDKTENVYTIVEPVVENESQEANNKMQQLRKPDPPNRFRLAGLTNAEDALQFF